MHFISRFSVVVVNAEAKILKVLGVNKFDLIKSFFLRMCVAGWLFTNGGLHA